MNDYPKASNYVQSVLNRPGNAKFGSLSNNIGSAASQAETLNEYLKESDREFLSEYNSRCPELRRTKMPGFMLNTYNYDVRQQVGLDFENKYNLRPIPEEAIILNEGMDVENQNPGY